MEKHCFRAGRVLGKAPARRLLKNAQKFDGSRPKAQGGQSNTGVFSCAARLEPCASPCTPQQACPVLDTGRDEGKAVDGRFSATSWDPGGIA